MRGRRSRGFEPDLLGFGSGRDLRGLVPRAAYPKPQPEIRLFHGQGTH